MTSFIRAYLRASTQEQDASRAKGQLQAFAQEKGLRIAAYYIENQSGASLQRPELFRLLEDSQQGDVILLEQVDRLSRLTAADWEALKATIAAKGLRIVALDLPTSWTMLTAPADDFTGRMLAAINAMLLDMLAAVARKDYEDRRRRQAQGIEKAVAAGRFKGKQADHAKRDRIARRLREGMPWQQIMDIEQTSRFTVAQVAKELRHRDQLEREEQEEGQQ